MPVLFSSIPEHIQHSIVGKVNVPEFKRFQICSKNSYRIAKRIKKRITHTVKFFSFNQENEHGPDGFSIKIRRSYLSPRIFKRIPVRIQTRKFRINGSLTNAYCQTITDFLLKTQSCTVSIEMDVIDCTPEQFNNLLEVSQACKLVCFQAIPPKFLKVPAMQKINTLSLYKVDYNDSEVLAIKRPRLDIEEAPFTSSGINLLLKQWLNCERDITKLSIQSSIKIVESEMFHQIPHTLVIMSNMRQEHTYTMFNDNMAEMLIVDVQLNRNSVSIWSHSTA